MTRPLRRRHLQVWLLLAVLLPLLFGAALLARRPTTPVNTDLSWEKYP